MAYAFFYDMPGTEELYRRVKAEIGEEAPKGLLVQLVVRQDGGLRHFNVWESRQDWERYRQERVGPPWARCWRPPVSPSARPSRSSSGWRSSTWSRAPEPSAR